MNSTNELLPKNHYFMNVQSDLHAICKPFFEKNAIKHFTYLRYYNDGSFSILITEDDLLYHHIQKQYILTPHVAKKLLDNQINYIPTPDLDDGFSNAAVDYRDLFNICYPLYMFERYQNYFDLFVYTSNLNNNKSINYYLNNMQTLDNFKLYFKDKASKLIGESYRNKIQLPENMRPNFAGLDVVASHDEPSELPIKSVSLTQNDNEISITKRELEVFQYLVRGLTVRDLSSLLNISPRTAEAHVKNVRHKLGVKRKSEVISILRDNYLLRH